MTDKGGKALGSVEQSQFAPLGGARGQFLQELLSSHSLEVTLIALGDK